MNPERFLYLTAFEKLAETRDRKLALNLLNEWSATSKKGKTLSAAAIMYLTKVVLPNLNGENTVHSKLERWIDELLFHPPEEPKDIPSFLKLFGSNYVETLSDRKMGGSTEVEIEEADWDAIVASAKKNNLGLHFCPLPIDGKERSERSGSRKLDRNVKRFSVLFADFDGGPKKKQEFLLLISLFPHPTMVVETKNGFHVYYFLEENMTEEEWRKTQKAIIKTFGSDPAIKSPAHLLRLPFSWHCKTDEKFFVQIHSFHWRRFKRQEVIEMFNVPKDEPPRNSRTFYLTTPFRGRRLRTPSVAGELAPGLRHPSLLEEAGRVYAGIDRSEAQNARDILHFWYERSCKPLKHGWQREVDSICDWIERHEWGSVVSTHHV